MAHIDILKQKKYAFGVKSAVGNVNRYEDRGYVGEIKTTDDLTMLVGIVADGVGSAEYGANAAQIAVDTVKDVFKNSRGEQIPALIEAAIKQANENVNKENSRSKGDGLTTLVVAVIHNDRCFIGNVGDSRAYWVQASGKMLQLTWDHTYYNYYGGDPDSDEAGVVINAVGNKESIVVDKGLYLKGKDPKEAHRLGVLGLPLKSGDSILLCSDGLIKKSSNGTRFAEDTEILEAFNTEFGQSAAVKMVGYAEGRKADDNVTAVTIQYLTPERISQMQSIRQAALRRAKVMKWGVGSGIGVLSLALMFVVFSLFKTQISLADALKRTPDTVFVEITNTILPSLTPTMQIDPGVARVDEIYGESAYILDEQFNRNNLLVGSIIFNGTILQTGDSGIRVVIGEEGGRPSVVFLFSNSEAELRFGEKLAPVLLKGSIFIQPGGGIAKIELGNFDGLVASVEGSRMIVEDRGYEVVVYCFEGICRLDYGLNGFLVPPGHSQSYNPYTEEKGPLEVMDSEIQWFWNSSCLYCMSDLIPTPLPTQTVTPTPKPIYVDPTEKPQQVDEPKATKKPPTKTPSPEPTITTEPTTAVPDNKKTKGPDPVPTTAVPTTAVPTTAVPTTAVPTTAVPTTAVPTTAVPTTAVPTTPVPKPED
jgi:serine/threonine protein phosphatase PrpC